MRNILGLNDDEALRASYFLPLTVISSWTFFAVFATFYTFSSFYNRNKNPTIRTAIIPSGNVSDAGLESETDSESLSDFESNEESESEVESQTEEEVADVISATESDSESTESIPTAKPSN